MARKTNGLVSFKKLENGQNLVMIRFGTIILENGPLNLGHFKSYRWTLKLEHME